MWLLYIFCLIPIIIGFIIWLCNKQINLIEWFAGTIAAFIVAGIIHAIAIVGLTADTEVWSGKITKAVHYPRWVEEYQVAIYKTVHHSSGSGENYRSWTTSEFSHFETRHRTHQEYWEAETDLDYNKTIAETFFKEISHNFSNLTTETPQKSGFDSGDRNIYVAYNKSGYIYPVTDTRTFENRIKAAPTVFSYPAIPQNIKVYDYPIPSNWLQSNRLINEKKIDILSFDRLNSRLGFKKKINIIMINFGKLEQSIAQYQEAKFIGGKKNDLVLCYGNVTTNGAGWAYCFGWSEKMLCKRNLETILLTNPINSDILPIIEREILTNYTKKDWHKFDYLTIEPRPNTYMWFFIIMFITQIGLYWLFLMNEFHKDSELGL